MQSKKDFIVFWLGNISLAQKLAAEMDYTGSKIFLNPIKEIEEAYQVMSLSIGLSKKRGIVVTDDTFFLGQKLFSGVKRVSLKEFHNTLSEKRIDVLHVHYALLPFTELDACDLAFTNPESRKDFLNSLKDGSIRTLVE